MDKRAVILLSGGLDSATTGAIARDQGFQLFALSVDYGQRHRFELAASRRVARAVGVRRHETVRVDLAKFGASALTVQIEVPKNRGLESIEDIIADLDQAQAISSVHVAEAIAFRRLNAGSSYT